MILLAVAGQPPRARDHGLCGSGGHLQLAAGNLIGGIAVQTMVLVLCDAAASRTQSLTFLVGSLIPVLEGLLVVAVVAEVNMGSLLPERIAIGSVSPVSIAIVVTWLLGIVLLNHVRRGSPWQCLMPGSRPGRPHHRVPNPNEKPGWMTATTAQAIAVFSVASAATRRADVLLEGHQELAREPRQGERRHLRRDRARRRDGAAGDQLGDRSGQARRPSELAVAPACSSGGNAFQVALFLVADLIAGEPVLPQSGNLDAWLAGLGIILTVIYCSGVIVRREGCHLRLGLDSMVVICVFALGIAGLVVVFPRLTDFRRYSSFRVRADLQGHRAGSEPSRGRRALRMAIVLAQTEQGRAAIRRAGQFASGPEGKQLLDHAVKAATYAGRTAGSPENRERLREAARTLRNRGR